MVHDSPRVAFTFLVNINSALFLSAMHKGSIPENVFDLNSNGTFAVLLRSNRHSCVSEIKGFWNDPIWYTVILAGLFSGLHLELK